MTTTNLLPMLDVAPQAVSIRSEVLETLAECPPRLPSKYFYDQRGSELFDAICELPEYYPTRTEIRIMDECLPELADLVGPSAAIIEIGSGSSMKTERLLAALHAPDVYLPMDISREHLLRSAERLAERHSDLEIAPICADFTDHLEFPEQVTASGKRVVYFPGSTLGNLPAQAADRLLTRFAELVRSDSRPGDGEHEGPSGGMILGVDLQKDHDVLRAAYDDSQGVTAQFNLNLLTHLNRQLDCDIPVSAFAHQAPYNEQAQRIEMHLVAQRDVEFTIEPKTFRFAAGERIVTEYSHKYAIPDLQQRLSNSGWDVRQVWTDPEEYFAILYCELL